MDNTVLFDVEEIKDAQIKDTLKEVYDALKERGYNPINQMVGYIITGDPGYISSYKDARAKMTELDRTEVAATLLKGYLK